MQLDWKIRQTTAHLNGSTRTQEVVVPFAGWVVSRSPSPAIAREQGSPASRAPENGFRFLAKVSSSQVESLQNAAEITLEIGDGNALQQCSGRFLRWGPIEGEPSMALVEMGCRPPPEVVEALSENNKVRGKFTWQPPVVSLWPFTVGFILFVLGSFGRALCLVYEGSTSRELSQPARTKSAPNSRGSGMWVITASESAANVGILPGIPSATSALQGAESPDLDLDSCPVEPNAAWLQAGSPGQMVEMLGIQLREAIIGETITQGLVVSAEWMLDRHRSRTVRIFRSVFRQDRSYLAHLDALPKFPAENKLSLYSRVLRILEAVGASPAQLGTIPATNTLPNKLAS